MASRAIFNLMVSPWSPVSIILAPYAVAVDPEVSSSSFSLNSPLSTERLVNHASWFFVAVKLVNLAANNL